MILICKQQQNSQLFEWLTLRTSSDYLTYIDMGEKSEKDTIETQENKAL